MKVKVFNLVENTEVGIINVRKNSSQKNILNHIKDFIIQKYDCTIKDYLISGNIDLSTHEKNIHYVLLGKNLPFNKISFEIVNE